MNGVNEKFRPNFVINIGSCITNTTQSSGLRNNRDNFYEEMELIFSRAPLQNII